jgi:hypothetical protein
MAKKVCILKPIPPDDGSDLPWMRGKITAESHGISVFKPVQIDAKTILWRGMDCAGEIAWAAPFMEGGKLLARTIERVCGDEEPVVYPPCLTNVGGFPCPVPCSVTVQVSGDPIPWNLFPGNQEWYMGTHVLTAGSPRKDWGCGFDPGCFGPHGPGAYCLSYSKNSRRKVGDYSWEFDLHDCVAAESFWTDVPVHPFFGLSLHENESTLGASGWKCAIVYGFWASAPEAYYSSQSLGNYPCNIPHGSRFTIPWELWIYEWPFGNVRHAGTINVDVV